MSIPNTEAEKFKDFVKNKMKPAIKKKPDCHIILFGSYFPDTDKELLIKIRDDLKNEGYTNTWLVEDYPDFTDTVDDREKSIACLEYSDINFFIATIDGKQGGWTIELEYVIQNAVELAFKTVLFHEIAIIDGRNVNALSNLHINGIYSTNLKKIKFKKSEYNELFAMIIAEAWRLHYFFVNYKKDY